MGLAELRALVLETNRAAFGSAVTVTVPDEDAVETEAIWASTETEEVDINGFIRKVGRYVLVLRKADVPTVPRKTIIVGAPPGGTSQRWMVDGTDRVEVDRTYVVLKPQAE
jgi:hypothetical protein